MDNSTHPAFARASCVGLSKREYAVIHIMAAIASARYPYDRTRVLDDAIFLVDGLFDRLEK